MEVRFEVSDQEGEVRVVFPMEEKSFRLYLYILSFDIEVLEDIAKDYVLRS